MAGRKPARMYRQIKGQSYTRRKYMGGVPHLRITNFETGNKKMDFPVEMELLVNNACAIRHNSLEAARIAANRFIQRRAGAQGYFLKVRVYPHEVIRENKRVNVAQADRFQEGMKKAWGKPTYVAARVQALQPVIIAEVDKEGLVHAKEALKRASAKFPSKCRIVVNEL